MDIPKEQAMVILLKSETFKMILEDHCTARKPPDELYALFEKEVNG